MVRNYRRVTCPTCGRRISAYRPHFGTGRGLRIIPHNIGTGRGAMFCYASRKIVVRTQNGTWALEPLSAERAREGEV